MRLKGEGHFNLLNKIEQVFFMGFVLLDVYVLQRY